jgi:hypothetical protein
MVARTKPAKSYVQRLSSRNSVFPAGGSTPIASMEREKNLVPEQAHQSSSAATRNRHPKIAKKRRRYISSESGEQTQGPTPERRGEIIEEILTNLQPRRGTSRAEVASAVGQALNRLREQVLWQTKIHDRAAMKKHARKLFKAAMKLEKLLELAPGMMHHLLFSDSEVSRVELPLKQAMRDGYLERSEAFFNELCRLHVVCGHIMGGKVGSHGNSDHAKSLSAWSAYGLMGNYSAAKITGTQHGPFWNITSLLYEALFEKDFEDGVDLKRACDAVLAANRV